MRYTGLLALGLLLGCGARPTANSSESGEEDLVPAAAPHGGAHPAQSSSAGTGAGHGGSAPGSGGFAGASDEAGSAEASSSFEQACVTGAATACEECLCTECTSQLEKCDATSGCAEITACIRDARCTGVDCYCGHFDAWTCLGGQSDGPCKATILAAPGGRAPTLSAPSAGPASDAALAIGDCGQPGKACAAACSNPG